MYHSIKRISPVLILLILIFLISFPLNDWLSVTMPRHQLIQLPAMFFSGFFLGIYFQKINISETSWGIAILIFVMSSFIFWMLPHSIDSAVIDPWFNRRMHLNMILCGALSIMVLRNISFEIKILFMGMLSAMILATGITLRAYNLILCSSFDISQQKETGFYLIISGFILFIWTFIVFFKKKH